MPQEVRQTHKGISAAAHQSVLFLQCSGMQNSVRRFSNLRFISFWDVWLSLSLYLWCIWTWSSTQCLTMSLIHWWPIPHIYCFAPFLVFVFAFAFAHMIWQCGFGKVSCALLIHSSCGCRARPAPSPANGLLLLLYNCRSPYIHSRDVPYSCRSSVDSILYPAI